MTKREYEAALKHLVANAPAAVAAQIPGWDAIAATVVPAATSTNGKKPPRPLAVTVETIEPTEKDDWKAFKVVKIDNGANGRYNRAKTLDARYLSALLAFLGFKTEQVQALVQRAGL